MVKRYKAAISHGAGAGAHSGKGGPKPPKRSARKERVLEAAALTASMRVREPSPRSDKIKCNACPSSESYRREEPQGLRRIMAENSRSRYVDAWICSDCGVEEAMRGFFWRDAALKNPATMKFVKPQWR